MKRSAASSDAPSVVTRAAHPSGVPPKTSIRDTAWSVVTGNHRSAWPMRARSPAFHDSTEDFQACHASLYLACSWSRRSVAVR